MTEKEKIKHYLEFKGVTKNRFYTETGLSQGFLDSGKTIGIDKAKIIIDTYPDISLEWLVLDKGEMIKQEIKSKVNSFSLRTDVNVENQLIPIYNLEASAGLVNLFQKQGDANPIDHLRIPNLPKCDGAVFVTGDSMYPLLKSGDIVAYKEIKDLPNEIFWGEMYIVSVEVAGEEFVSVKYVQKSDLGQEYITLVSHNQHHAPKNVHLSKVRAMAMVKASVRINSMS